MNELAQHADDDFCYLTTTGRVTGNPHEIEIWFALNGSRLYLLAGGGKKSDWVRNLLRNPSVQVRLGNTTHPGRAFVVEDAQGDAEARRLVVGKYQPRTNDNLDEWGRTALSVAVDLE